MPADGLPTPCLRLDDDHFRPHSEFLTSRASSSMGRRSLTSTARFAVCVRGYCLTLAPAGRRRPRARNSAFVSHPVMKTSIPYTQIFFHSGGAINRVSPNAGQRTPMTPPGRPRRQLPWAEGLGEIIIRADRETQYL